MTPSKLIAGVTRDTCLAVTALAGLAVWLGGVAAGMGVLAGGGLAIGNFRWLVLHTTAATAAGAAPPAAWLIGTALRFAACAAACAALLAGGWVHPLGLVAGFTVFPCALVAHGLAAAHEAD